MKVRNMSRSVEEPAYRGRTDTLGNRRNTPNRLTVEPDDFFSDDIGVGSSRNFGLATSLQERVKGQLPLPKLGLASPWWLKTGLRFCGSRRVSHVLHVICGLLYSICGLAQFVAGIYFMLELPIFQLGSNIWTGAWNLFSGVATVSLACFGDLSVLKAQVLLLLSLVITIVNLINLIILEVGEWRGFLSFEDREYVRENGLDDLMHLAYVCTTTGTVVAMICAFLSSQQTFCFLQLRGDDHKKQNNNNNNNINNHVDQVDSDTILRKDLVKRHDDDLNLKTPIGPEPHPSWVYRHNYAALHSNRAAGSPVKRSISVLNALKNGGAKTTAGTGAASTTSSTSTMDRVELLGGLHPKSPNARKMSTPGVFTISESVNDAGRMRHAVIRRHQSLYIHPKTSSDVMTSQLTSQQPFKFPDSNSDIRQMRGKTLQRSKTTVGQTLTSLQHKSSAIQSLQRTFRGLKQQQQQIYGNTLPSSTSGFRFDHNNNNNNGHYSLKRKSTSPNRYHHYPTEDVMCEFQAGPSFDLPDREKLRRNGWQTEPKYVNSGAVGNSNNGRNVIFDTSDNSTIRRSAIKRVIQHPDDLLLDSSDDNIRYQAVEGLVQNNNRQKRQSSMNRQGHYSSLENLLSERDPEHERIQMGAMVRYGSTGSLSSLASDRIVVATGGGGHRDAREAGMTPTSLYSQNSSSVLTKYYDAGGLDISQDDSQVSNDVVAFSSEDVDDMYDVPRRPNGVTLRKSNSRVSSNGKLRLRVESFRNNNNNTNTSANNNAKSSSGTQTDISVVRNASSHKTEQQQQEQAGYTGQYKKRAAPNKPARKQKVLRTGQSDIGTEIRSDRSASPDNSSTSGYSSPSAAGAQDSKESSPCNSKIPSPPQSMNDHEEEEEEESNKITVIQIVPKEVKDRNDGLDTDAESDRRPSSDDGGAMMLSAATLMQQQQHHQQQQRHTRRELPRIATNGTLTRPGAAGKRRLPDRTLPPAPEPVHAFPPPGVRLFRSNLPRPAPMVHHHQQFAQGRVPLPPVPELDRSDHERESMSPVPEQRNLRPNPPKPKALPSPLVTPIQPAERHLPKPRRISSRAAELPMLPPMAQTRTLPQDRNFYGRNNTNGPTLHKYGSPSTPSSLSNRMSDYESSDSNHRLSRDLDDDFEEDEIETGSSQESAENVDDRLKALIELMGSRGGGNGLRDGSGHPVEKEDTLKYLSQLETVARRLKDQLLSDRKKLPSPITRRQSHTEAVESDC